MAIDDMRYLTMQREREQKAEMERAIAKKSEPSAPQRSQKELLDSIEQKLRDSAKSWGEVVEHSQKVVKALKG